MSGADLGAEQITFRSATTPADYEQCLELQRLTWGNDYRELVPPTILKIAQKVGGVVGGAFDHDGRMLGFVFGLSGVRDDRRAHWSHMLAVRPEARGLGLGRQLKLFQRQLLLPLGVEVVYWTYDPLIARNANLNLNRLGAKPTQYVRDMYGRSTGSEVHDALGTDRFIVEWEIGADEVSRRLAGSRADGPAPLPEQDAILGTSDLVRGEPLDCARAPRPGEEYWVEVPRNVEELQGRDLERARRWRAVTRAAIEAAFALGLEVRGLAIGVPQAARGVGAADRRYFYWFTPATSLPGR